VAQSCRRALGRAYASPACSAGRHLLKEITVKLDRSRITLIAYLAALLGLGGALVWALAQCGC
jgi:hypothetical protein